MKVVSWHIQPLPKTCACLSQLTFSFPGLVVLGGSGLDSDVGTSVEFWSEVKCALPDLSRDMYIPSVNFIQDTIVACFKDSCDMLQDGMWVKVADTLHTRTYHSSAVIGEQILLVGGESSPTTTELVDVNGGEVREGFSLDPGRRKHCSVQITATSIVITGGGDTESRVTLYEGIDQEATPQELPDLLTGRRDHGIAGHRRHFGRSICSDHKI